MRTPDLSHPSTCASQTHCPPLFSGRILPIHLPKYPQICASFSLHGCPRSRILTFSCSIHYKTLVPALPSRNPVYPNFVFHCEERLKTNLTKSLPPCIAASNFSFLPPSTRNSTIRNTSFPPTQHCVHSSIVNSLRNPYEQRSLTPPPCMEKRLFPEEFVSEMDMSREVSECRKIETLENLYLDFDDDVQELETLGVTVTNVTKPSNTPTAPDMTDPPAAPTAAAMPVAPSAPDIPADSRHLPQLPMEQLRKEKQLDTGVDGGPEECRNKDDWGFESPGEKLSNLDKSSMQDSDLKTSDACWKILRKLKLLIKGYDYRHGTC
ncbi:hypothetical protein P7K49_005523 [Saguinus oedipus]|uniref:Uncharacterized protein n=1 Tax=Saguinus oedipus TaxID=9490 RepID=A0ABQ9VZV2_SAGOE|nr:hypothetical protein P7K49_005523 [Saguinus oedipus]